MEIEVAADVAELVGEDDLAQLLAAAERSYDCVACQGPGTLADDPAAVVVLRSGDLMVARVAHAGCRSSRIVELPPGALRVAEQAPAVAVAAVLPHSEGPRPVLVVELGVTVSVRELGERVDILTAGLLRGGLHLVGSAGRMPGVADGWRVQITGPTAVRIIDRTGDHLYDGNLIMPPSWLRLVGERGNCALLCATGLGLSEGLGDVAEGLRRLNAVARAGRLVGGLVPVTR